MTVKLTVRGYKFAKNFFGRPAAGAFPAKHYRGSAAHSGCLSPPPSPSPRGSAYARCACARAPHAPALRPRPSSPRPAPRSDSCFFESKKASCNGNVTARSARGLACGKRANRGSAAPLGWSRGFGAGRLPKNIQKRYTDFWPLRKCLEIYSKRGTQTFSH